jgi:hypothetical protein
LVEIHGDLVVEQAGLDIEIAPRDVEGGTVVGTVSVAVLESAA